MPQWQVQHVQVKALLCMQARQHRHFVSWFVLHGVRWHVLNSQLISVRVLLVGEWVPQWQVQHMRRGLTLHAGKAA